MSIKIFFVLTFLFSFLPSLNAESVIINPKEYNAWLRHLIPLPHEIAITEKITLDPKDISITVRSNSGEIERQAAAELRELFKEKTGDIPSGKIFEILIGVVDAREKIEGVSVRNVTRLNELPNNDQAYIIQPDGKNKLILTGLNEKGVYYAVRTLYQLLEPFISEESVSIPLAEVIDWPDIEERGLWNFPNPPEWIPWLASLKLNYGKMAATKLDMIERGKKNHATIDKDLMLKSRLMAFNYLPLIVHLNFLDRYGLFQAYPELAGVGDSALAGRYFAHKQGSQHRVPCASNPILTKILAEWMMDIASQGADEVSCWLSERPAQCGCKKCTAVGQFVLEARAFVDAWRETRKKYPGFIIRLFISTTTSERYYKILAEIPPEVKIERCCATSLERVANIPRDIFANPLLDRYSAQGTWIASYDVPLTANGLVDTPEFKVPQSSAHRIRDFVSQLIERKYQGAYGMMAWSNLAKEICNFNISALAEWSWNCNGRSEKEFAIAWATLEGYDNPEAVGEWSELMGHVEFDVYDSEFPIVYSWGLASEMIKKRTRPYLGEGIFRYYINPEDFDRKINVCARALEIAKSFKDPYLANETKVVMSYIRLAKCIYEIAEQVAVDYLSTMESQDKLRGMLTNLESAGQQNVAAIKEWRGALGHEPWHYRVHDAINGTETTVIEIVQTISGKYFF